MSSEIQQIRLSDQTTSEMVDDEDYTDKKSTAMKTAVVDIEEATGDLSDETTCLPLLKSERTELIPGEAFQWDVSGDQSPCMLTVFLIIRHRQKIWY